MTKRVTLTLGDGLAFTARTESGHEVAMDSPLGAGVGPSPMEVLLSALGGCSAMDVISILRKMRQDVTAYEVELEGEQAEEHPKKYTQVAMVHRLRGNGLDEPNVRRAIELTMVRYCPVYAMLAPTVRILERYEVADAAGAPRFAGDLSSPPATQVEHC